MFSNFIKHITNHKVGYGIGAGVFGFLVLAVMASPTLFGVNLLGLPRISRVIIVYPNGGEILNAGQTISVRFKSAKVPLATRLWVSAGSPSTRTRVLEMNIKTPEKNTKGEYVLNYTIPNDLDVKTGARNNRYFFQVEVNFTTNTNTNWQGDWSNRYVTINKAAPSLQVISPNGGTFNEGDQLMIKIEAKMIDPRTTPIEISLEGSDGINQSITTINNLQLKDSASDVYTYVWQIGTQGLRTLGTTYKIRAKIANPTSANLNVTNSTAFTINELKEAISSIVPAVKVVTPNGGETFHPGDTLNIKWDANVKPVMVTLNRGNYTTSEAFSINENATESSLTWTIPQNIFNIFGNQGAPDFFITVLYRKPDGNGVVMDTSDTYFKILETPTATLNVIKTSMPAQTQVVKGSKEVQVLGFGMQAGLESGIIIKNLYANLYGDDDGAFDGEGFGDTAANTLAVSIGLYEGDKLLSGPVAVTPVNTDKGFTFYSANFQNLNMQIAAGASKELNFKVNLLNTASATQYLAVDLDPALGIIATDTADNALKAITGSSLNFSANPEPRLTILPRGILSVGTNQSMGVKTLKPGESGNVSSPFFRAQEESMLVRKLTIINDNDSDPAFTNPQGTSAIAQVQISYRDKDGNRFNPVAEMINGQATFRNLNFYIPKDTEVWNTEFLEIAVTATDLAIAPDIAGESIRLGILENNTIATFEAIGENSASTIQNVSMDQSKIESVQIQGNALTLTKNYSVSSVLIGYTESTLLSFNAAINSGAQEGVAIRHIEATVTATPELTISGYRLYRSYGDYGLVAENQNAPSFDFTENFSGEPKNYRIAATVTGVKMDSTVTIALSGITLDPILPINPSPTSISHTLRY